MFNFDETQQSIKQLLLESKEYYELQKQILKLDVAEKLTVLLSGLAIAVVCLVLGSLALFFLTFASAYWVGNLLGNQPMGFAAIALLFILIMYIVYLQRNKWIIQPMARLIVKLFINDEEDPNEIQEG